MEYSRIVSVHITENLIQTGLTIKEIYLLIWKSEGGQASGKAWLRGLITKKPISLSLCSFSCAVTFTAKAGFTQSSQIDVWIS